MIFEKQVVGAYRAMAYTRCDDNGTAFYFSAEDFAGLTKEPFSFASSMGHTLKGYLYAYEAPIAGRLVVFDHGFGGGHRSYMKEIEMLCRHGYRVLAYDHTGCMESGGESPNGMAQSLCDLNDCLTALRADARFSGTDISVMGHSWGGFSTLNITALHPDVSHVVVLSGFVSVERLVDTFFSGLMKGYRAPVMALERTANPYFVTFDATKSLARTDARVLLIYSEDDRMCTRLHYDLLAEALAGKENVTLRLLAGKGHNPNYTADAVGYLGEYVKAKSRFLKRKGTGEAERAAFRACFDWDRMTAQDGEVWKEIFDCLDG